MGTNWSDINLCHDKNGDILWGELIAIYAFVDTLKPSLQGKTVHIFTDNEACKFMLINVRSKLARPDLQRIINELCKIFIQFAITPWIEHIPGKDDIIPDRLSRNLPIPSHLMCNCKEIMDVSRSVQFAADLCKNIVIKNKHLINTNIES